MAIIQPIEHRGHVVGLVAGGRALVDDERAAGALALVRAKCLYALQIQAGERLGPYTDEAASRYARHAVDARGRARPPTSTGSERRSLRHHPR